METLQQILEKMDEKTWRIVTPNGTFHTFQVIDAVKKWLTQKQLSLNKSDAYNRDHLKGKQEVIEELLKDNLFGDNKQ